MVYLDCPHCKETTEHQIIGLRKDKVTTRCTECVNEFEGIISHWQMSKMNIGDRKK